MVFPPAPLRKLTVAIKSPGPAFTSNAFNFEELWGWGERGKCVWGGVIQLWLGMSVSKLDFFFLVFFGGVFFTRIAQITARRAFASFHKGHAAPDIPGRSGHQHLHPSLSFERCCWWTNYILVTHSKHCQQLMLGELHSETLSELLNRCQRAADSLTAEDGSLWGHVSSVRLTGEGERGVHCNLTRGALLLIPRLYIWLINGCIF